MNFDLEILRVDCIYCADKCKIVFNGIGIVSLGNGLKPLKCQSRLQQMTFINIFSLFFREKKT